MIAPYVHGPALLIECSAGQGAIVLVEGETFQEDSWFYGQWFGDRAREVSFFPQNGWGKVVAAVADLRSQLPNRDVFGIIDRDFADDTSLAQQSASAPIDGAFRTAYFTVENYLLDPAGWLRVLRTLSRGALPVGWQTESDVSARIGAAYRRCMDLAAFNYTVHREHARVSQGAIPYKKHPNAMTSAVADLLAWGATRAPAPPTPLDQAYQAHQAMIQGLAPAEWPKWITGKAVLKVFLEDFAIRSIPHEILKSLYINAHAQVPPDLDALVTRIVERHGDP